MSALADAAIDAVLYAAADAVPAANELLLAAGHAALALALVADGELAQVDPRRIAAAALSLSTAAARATAAAHAIELATRAP